MYTFGRGFIILTSRTTSGRVTLPVSFLFFLMASSDVEVLEERTTYVKRLKREPVPPNDLLKLFRDKAFSDVKLCPSLGNHAIVIEAHRVVLASCSNFLYKKFIRFPNPSDVILLQVTEKCLRQILNLIYGEVVTVRSEEEFEELSMTIRALSIRINFENSHLNEEVYKDMKMTSVGVKREHVNDEVDDVMVINPNETESSSFDISAEYVDSIHLPGLPKMSPIDSPMRKRLRLASPTIPSNPADPLGNIIRPMQLLKQEHLIDRGELAEEGNSPRDHWTQEARSIDTENMQDIVSEVSPKSNRTLHHSKELYYRPGMHFMSRGQAIRGSSVNSDVDNPMHTNSEEEKKALPLNSQSQRPTVLKAVHSFVHTTHNQQFSPSTNGLFWLQFKRDTSMTEASIRQNFPNHKIIKTVFTDHGYLGFANKDEADDVISLNSILPESFQLKSLSPSTGPAEPTNCKWWLVFQINEASKNFTASSLRLHMKRNNMTVSQSEEPLIYPNSVEVPFDEKYQALSAEKRYKGQVIREKKVFSTRVEPRS